MSAATAAGPRCTAQGFLFVDDELEQDGFADIVEEASEEGPFDVLAPPAGDLTRVDGSTHSMLPQHPDLVFIACYFKNPRVERDGKSDLGQLLETETTYRLL